MRNSLRACLSQGTAARRKITRAMGLIVLIGSVGHVWTSSPSVNTSAGGEEIRDPNPFGIMLTGPLPLSRRLEVAKALGVRFFRPESVFADRWNGTCSPCDAALDAGLELVLTVRANGGLFPTSPPRDMQAYRRVFADILDRYRPAIVAIENEENSALFYTGTPEQYGMELKAACDVAHQKGVACTNGGLVSTLVALLVYNHYREIGDQVRAEDFRARVFTPEEQRMLETPRAREQVEKGKQLLVVYKTAAVDYVNFHWYIADPGALEEAVAYLREQTGLPVLTNEVGQFTDDPTQTWTVMSKIVQLRLPIAVWFAQDGPKARGLINRDGSFRPTGEAFRQFIAQNFGAGPAASEGAASKEMGAVSRRRCLAGYP